MVPKIHDFEGFIESIWKLISQGKSFYSGVNNSIKKSADESKDVIIIQLLDQSDIEINDWAGIIIPYQ